MFWFFSGFLIDSGSFLRFVAFVQDRVTCLYICLSLLLPGFSRRISVHLNVMTGVCVCVMLYGTEILPVMVAGN